MKRKGLLTTLYLLSLLVFSFPLTAQDYCATEMPEEMDTWLREYKAEVGSNVTMNARSGVSYIPVQVHIVGTDQGGGYYKFPTLLDAMCTLNQQYQDVGFYFYMYDDVNYIDDDDIYEHTYNQTALISSYNVEDVANMYIVEDPSGACGYFTGWGDYIAINKSCGSGDNSTMAHEFGHYFSLPHTFSGWEGRDPFSDPAQASDERVNGSNCSFRGDYFCDTPADFISDRWQCPYTGSKEDYNGQPYNPDGALFMSYANDNCQNYFSAEQTDAMQQYLVGQRSELLSHPEPNVIEIPPTTALFPPDGFEALPANYATITWDAVPGATHYHLTATRFINPNFVNVDMITTDTSVVLTDLDEGYTYRWKVRAFSNLYTCSPYTQQSEFTTKTNTDLTLDLIVDQISCAGAEDAFISINAQGGAGGYTYKWSDTSITSPNRTGLAAGTYVVTVSDVNTDSVVLPIDILALPELEAEVVNNQTTFTANVTGGTPPYNYFWSNGGTGSNISVAEPGTYSVTVSDSKGCNLVASGVFTSLEENELFSGVKLFPNPLNNENLTVQVNSTQNVNGTLQVFNSVGQQVLAEQRDFANGQNTFTLNTRSLDAGVYMLNINTEAGVMTRKFVVF